ncbi:TPA: filamentous hemagglutinin N-terminal domain-containing protein [Salmonella enterica]|nr:filamentous hemagglutinin N-terminal domain-containing protein [Salmonella enterica]
MNKIYRLKFDKRRNELVVVSEITVGMGKEKNTGHIAAISDIGTFRKLLSTLTPLAFLTGMIISLLPGVALANPDLPSGGQIVGGQGSISTSGSQMTIHQQTQNMATNWHSFDIGKNNTVQFIQPDSSAVALNRVTGASGSQIMGTLKANGRVFILNPNGVLFGKDARVNVAGLVASTKNINTADFMKGQYTLSSEGNPGAQVVNQGSLTTSKGGYIVLVGERVSNSGSITTPSGKTVLAAGKTVTLQLDNGGLTSVSVDGSVVNALVENRGLISATSGQVFLTAKGRDMLLNTVVNNSGSIEAKGLESRGGEIVLDGGDSGVVSQSGQLLADSHTDRGGKITLEGENIHLVAGSRTSATGKTGGGEVFTGGGWRGKDSRISNASGVVMDRAATVDVSAAERGNGGTAVLWSDDYTNFRGAILARAGTQSGNGGRVETSSHQNLQAFGDVDTSARAGRGGEWLLDPADVTVVSGGTNANVSETGKGAGGADLDVDTVHVFTPSATGAQVGAASIQTQLNNGTDVTIETSGVDISGQQGNITVNADVNLNKDKGGDATLTLKADNNIRFINHTWSAFTDKSKGVINSSAGKLNLNLLSGNSTAKSSVQFGSYVHFFLNGGDFYAGTKNTDGAASINFANAGKIEAGNITLDAAGGTNINFSELKASNNLTINGSFSMAADYGILTSAEAGNLLVINAPDGGIRVTSTGNNDGSGKVTLSGDKGVDIRTQNGLLSMTALNDNKHGITVSSANGSVALAGKVQDGNAGLVIQNVSISSKDKVSLNGTTYWGQAASLDGLKLNATGDVDISGIAKKLDTGVVGAGSSTGVTLSNSNITSDKGNVTLTGLSGAVSDAEDGKDALSVSNSNITATAGTIHLNGTTEVKRGVRVTNSNLSATNLDVSGEATKDGTGLVIQNVNISSVEKTTLHGKTFWGQATSLDGLKLSATGDVDISGMAKNPSKEEEWGAAGAVGMTLNNSNITSTGGSVTLTGLSGATNGNSNALGVSNSSITANAGTIHLNGSTKYKQGVQVTGSNLSAANLEVKGVATDSGTGFSFSNTHLKGALTSLGNVTLSSAGSAVGVTNSLDGTFADMSDTAIKNTLLKKHIENLTRIEMGGDSIFDDTGSDTKGWTANYPHEDTPYGGWIFNNTSVTASGDVNLQGIAFSNATITLSKGNFTLNNTGPVVLDDGTLTVSDGGVNISSGGGGISAVHTNITAKNDISLTSKKGAVSIFGKNADTRSDISSSDGNVTIDTTGDSVGARIRDANITANNGHINLNGSATTGGFDFSVSEQAGIILYGNLLFKAKNGTTINATHSGRAKQYSPPVPLVLEGVNLTFDGGAEINAYGSYTGIVLSTGEMAGDSTSHIFVKNGDLNINAMLDGKAEGGPTGGAMGTTSGAFVLSTEYNPVTFELNVDKGSNITINADSSANKSGPFAAFASATPEATATLEKTNGFVFSGGGNVSVCGTSDSADAVNLRLFNNKDLTGNLVITGTSNSGVGVNFDKYLSTNVSNATITGNSGSGVGVQMTAKAGSANLNGNNVSGSTATGNGGIVLSGSNITVTNGKLTGNATAGKGSGLVLNGGSNYTIDGASITGTSASGSGVSVDGTLTVNNGTKVEGKSTGTGNGVSVSGSLVTTTGTGVTLNGTAVSGDGIKVAGSTTLTQAVLKGQTDSGNGVNIAGNLTTDKTTQIQGQATGQGTGVTLGASLTGANVSGISEQGVGLKLADNAVVTDASLKGESTDGSGVAVTGSISLDNTTAAGLNATSVSGAGLSLEDNTNISIAGIPTAPVSLTGTSQKGSGVATSGNVSISGVVLNGHATTAEGTGATLSGNLTIADNISGVNVSATGNGTALVLNNATVNASGYSRAGQDFILNATTDGDGSAIRTTGNNTLTSVELSGTAKGNGSAVVINGTLSTDKDISVVSSGDKGTGLELNGGTLVSTQTDNKPVNVNVSAAGNGTAVQVTSGGDSSLNNITLHAVADEGSTLNVAGNLTSNVNLTVSTVNGTALTLSGGKIESADSKTPVTVNVSATGDSGTAVYVTKDHLNSLSNITLNASSTGGDAVSIEGTLETQNTDITANTTGTGTALKVSGGMLKSVGSTVVNATAGNGHAAEINNGRLTGSSAGSLTVSTTSGNDEPALNISGNSEVSNSSVSGTNNGTGSAVTISGHLTSDGGGSVTGNTTGGTAVTIADGSVITGTSVTGNAGTGTGIKAEGNISLGNVHLNGTSESGSGLNVTGTLTGDQFTTLNTGGTVMGDKNIHILKPVIPPPATEDGGNSSQGHNTGNDETAGGSPSVPPESENSQRQGAVNAQIIRMNQPVQDGFHATGTPPVPVSGYQPVERKVDISLCDGENCRSESLDASKPAEGKTSLSGK